MFREYKKIDWPSVIWIVLFCVSVPVLIGAMVHDCSVGSTLKAEAEHYTSVVYKDNPDLPEGTIIRCIAGVEYYASGKRYFSLSPRFLPGKSIPESCKREVGR